MSKWSDIYGQQRILGVIERAMTTERMHHAYLFSGKKGVGKHLTACTFAAAVNCVQRANNSFHDPCGSCTSCRKVSQRQHPDVFFLKPEGANIKISQVRAIQKEVHKKPYEARARAVLFDDAHLMTEEAANALLKTLEEPSTQTIFFLVTDQPHRLLDTIISRCQHLRFASLAPSVITTIVQRTLRQEITDKDELVTLEPLVPIAARYGEGSVGQAVSVLLSGRLHTRQDVISRCLAIRTSQPREMLELAVEFGKDKEELHGLFDLLKSFFRDLMLLEVTPELDNRVHTDIADLMRAAQRQFSLDQALDIIAQLCYAQDLLTRNINPQLVVEHFLRYLGQCQTMTGSGERSTRSDEVPLRFQ